MTDSITYRPRTIGAGLTKDEIRSRLLQLAGGSIVKAFEFACHDLSEATKGGLYRLPPMGGPADVKPDDGEGL